MRIVDTRALVTGGAVYADCLGQRGHDPILVTRNKERLASLAAACPRHGPGGGDDGPTTVDLN